MEFEYKFDGYESDADVMVLAGDIDNHRRIFDTLEKLYGKYGKHIIYVPGNHEYYGTSHKTMTKRFHDYCNGHISILNNDMIVIDGVLFIGGTGWWDESNGLVYPAIKHMTDYSSILDIKNNENGVVWGRECYNYFKYNLDGFLANCGYQVVCVSHNGPLNLPAPKYKYSGINTCFYNKWDDLLIEYSPAVWIYGHTHDSNRQNIYGVDLICNPKGYFDENPEFDPKLIVEI